ncbi:MAG: MarR family transcriptional regulator [Clostridium sp.]|nr:MarR family transcriptional regulator [Clostridium sp.]MDY5483673.1 MarR family transcriptional regulator [Clostridium sp.]
MENQEHDTLESIIRAAREMSLRRSPSLPRENEATKEQILKQERPATAESNAPSIEEGIQKSDSPIPEENFGKEAPGENTAEDLLSAARAFSETLHTSGVHFLEFSVAFLSMFKRHYQLETNDIRANSLAFFALIALDSWANGAYTMSELADKLQVPKQQLTKLINDLEERKLVERTHDTTNRRRVYIRICEPGRCLMEDVKQKMLQATLHGLRSYSMEELLEMDQCICRLTELMERFNTDLE